MTAKNLGQSQRVLQVVRFAPARNKLYFGDNLVVLRNSISDESVDLIYLDPPFNSNATYNVLFKSPRGHDSHAQIKAFEDTWHWSEQAEREYTEILHQSNTDIAERVQALRRLLGDNDMMAYLTMMANRLLELRRVLKPTGALYLHCDPAASHYLKIVLDGVFGIERFTNEIIWKRTSSKSDHAQGARHFPRLHDTILYYQRSNGSLYEQMFADHDPAYVKAKYPHTDSDGRRYGLWDMTGPGGAAKGNPHYEVMDVARYWRYSKERMERMIVEGRVIQPKPGAVPREKRFLEDSAGVAIGDVWTDIAPINSQAQERLGYPTQKPLALLERIISASSKEGDVVLDPFCGCGTAIHAAQKLKRQWIGIDITNLAIGIVEKRLRETFPGISFKTDGRPEDLDGARELAARDKYEFQYWACALVNAQPYQNKKKGSDGGIDGVIYFQHDAKQTEKIVVSVKSGDNVGVAMVRDLGHVIEREKAAMGFFVTLTPPSKPMITEAAAMGFYASPISGARYPRLQILTIEGLLNGTVQARYPQPDAGSFNLRKARRERKLAAQGELFDQSNKAAIMDRRMAVVCTLVNRLADEPHFGRTKMAKLFYLADSTENLELDTTYYRKAAGPLDTAALYDAETGLEAFAEKHGYLSVERSGRKVTYRRGPNLEAALDLARKVLGSKRTAMNRLIDRFRKLDTDQCEIVATLYACWNDRLLDGKDTSEQSVIDEFLESWHEKKRRFSQDRLVKALVWMKQNGLAPMGRGRHTRRN